MTFFSALRLGSIVTLPTLLLLDLECGLGNDDVDDDMQHPPRHLQLGRGMDHPLQDSTRGGCRRRRRHRGDPVCLHLFLFMSGTRKEEVNNNNIEEETLLIPLTVDD